MYVVWDTQDVFVYSDNLAAKKQTRAEDGQSLC